MLHTAESNFSNFVIEYLSEIETEFENTFACLSGAQKIWIMKKTGGWKSRDTLPLSAFTLYVFEVVKLTIFWVTSSTKFLCLSELGTQAHSNQYIDEKGIGFTYIIKYFILTCKAFSKFSFHEADNVKNLRCQVKSLKS